MIKKLINISQIKLLNYKVPKELFLETSNICNANCIFCAYQFDKREKKIMSFDLFQKIVDEYKNIGGKRINLTPYAGEVLIDKGFIEKVTYLKKIGYKNISTYTNLTFLDSFDINDFLECGLTDLSISIAPLDENSYEKIFRNKSFNRVFENLLLFLENFHKNNNKTIKKVNISFRSNVDIQIIKDMDNFKKINKFIKNGVIVTNMTIFDSWMDKIDKEDLLDGMTFKSPDFDKPLPCDRLFMLKVHSDGTMRACGCRYDYSSSSDNFALGDYKDINILKAYNSNTVKKLKESFLKNDIPKECQECA
ncbi:MAG: radical SAM protein, partial [Sulfurimonadaceae bacterium]|nr:radical SAM protein [Sulfurimonadaceae bacterium]